MAALYAGVAGLMLVTDDPFFGLPVSAAGGGAMLAGLACLVGLAEAVPSRSRPSWSVRSSWRPGW